MKFFYIWDESLIKECDRLPAVPGRASMVHDLIAACGLITHYKVIRSTTATYKDLKEFHSDLYLDHLQSLKDIDDEYSTTNQDEEHGIGYDCPPVSNIFELVSTIAGGSLTAAKCLILGVADVVINWCGGWHHAHRFGAEGFCYVNDIVLAIEKIRTKFPKVLYIDVDVHHGNGVQDAFNLSKSVFTLSLHKYEPGFYPGTGSLSDIGEHSGQGYSCNFPLHEGYSDETFVYAFEHVFASVYDHFAPDAIVMQCGADALAQDPHGGARLTANAYCTCVRTVLDKRKPTLLLGGGGYNHPNAARLWTSITAAVAGVTLDENIPDHDHWPSYGPGYTFAIEPTLARDANTRTYLDECISTIQDNLEKYLKEKMKADIKRTNFQNNIKSDDEITAVRHKKPKLKHNCKLTELKKNQNSNMTKDDDVYAFIE